MKQLALNIGSTAWVGSEGTEAPLSDGVRHEAVLPAHVPPTPTAPTRIVIEVQIGRGPMVAYGLLGATYQPSSGDGLTVTTTSGSLAPPLRRPNAPVSEVTRVGLPEEYRAAVTKGVEISPALHPGRLTFDQAVIGEVGSSPLLFRQLAVAITSLIFGGEQDPVAALRHAFELD